MLRHTWMLACIKKYSKFASTTSSRLQSAIDLSGRYRLSDLHLANIYPINTS
jgi:hypothetical protein